MFCYNKYIILSQREREVLHMAGTIIYNKLLKMMEEKGLSTYKIRKDKIMDA